MTTWILLRGLTREAGHWGSFRHRLAQQAGGQDAVIALDLPGNGVLHGKASPASVPYMARACRAELARRGVAPPYVLVAMSLGAMVALDWCHEAPVEVAGCVLINTSARGQGWFWQRLRPRNYASLLGLLRPGLPALQRETAILGMTSSDPARHAGVAAQWAAMAISRPVRWQNALRQLLAAARYVPPVGRPGMPMLLLASEDDTLVSVQCSRDIAARWELPLQVHPHAGHDLPLDDPGWVLAQLGAWCVSCRADS